MPRKFKEARKLRRLTAVAAAKEMNISNPTITAWESGRKTPSIEGLEKMADLYQVTTDYLLGRPEPEFANPSSELPLDLIRIFDGRPAWSEQYGWVLVNGPDCTVTAKDGRKITLESAGILRAAPHHYAVSALPESKALLLKELLNFETVWVEPISVDAQIRDELRGWYKPKGFYVENSAGNRFLYDTYGSKWLAFRKG